MDDNKEKEQGEATKDYIKEAIDYFIAKRGSSLAVSAKDWALLDLWERARVPLEIIKQGIDRLIEQRTRLPMQKSSDVHSISQGERIIWELWMEHKLKCKVKKETLIQQQVDNKSAWDIVFENFESIEKRWLEAVKKNRRLFENKGFDAFIEGLEARFTRLHDQLSTQKIAQYHQIDSALREIDNFIFDYVKTNLPSKVRENLKIDAAVELKRSNLEFSSQDAYEIALKAAYQQKIRDLLEIEKLSLANIIQPG